MDRQPRIIDLDTWPRREHYEFFRPYPFPFFSITTSVDVAPLRKLLKARNASFTAGLLYVLTRAANAVPQFRQRIREEAPIEYEIIHAGVTVLCPSDIFQFCTLDYTDDFERFVRETSQAIDRARQGDALVPNALVDNGRIRDDMIYCTSLPWFTFTGMLHPLGPDPMDSVPRVAWGRFEAQAGRLVMPLNVQAHHALIDGVHLAKFFHEVEALIKNVKALP